MIVRSEGMFSTKIFSHFQLSFGSHIGAWYISAFRHHHQTYKKRDPLNSKKKIVLSSFLYFSVHHEITEIKLHPLVMKYKKYCDCEIIDRNFRLIPSRCNGEKISPKERETKHGMNWHAKWLKLVLLLSYASETRIHNKRSDGISLNFIPLKTFRAFEICRRGEKRFKCPYQSQTWKFCLWIEFLAK